MKSFPQNGLQNLIPKSHLAELSISEEDLRRFTSRGWLMADNQWRTQSSMLLLVFLSGLVHLFSLNNHQPFNLLYHSPNGWSVPSHHSPIALAKTQCLQGSSVKFSSSRHTPHQSYIQIGAPCNGNLCLKSLVCTHFFQPTFPTKVVRKEINILLDNRMGGRLLKNIPDSSKNKIASEEIRKPC